MNHPNETATTKAAAAAAEAAVRELEGGLERRGVDDKGGGCKKIKGKLRRNMKGRKSKYNGFWENNTKCKDEKAGGTRERKRQTEMRKREREIWERQGWQRERGIAEMTEKEAKMRERERERERGDKEHWGRSKRQRERERDYQTE